MKNLHIIPTDKPSRLHEFGDIWFSHKEPTECFRNYNIYITSDEEIKEGDWCINLAHKQVVKPTDIEWANSNKDNLKKIILTTDPQLIENGVQAIDDGFLEWFVKNPSCENVKVELIEEIPSGFTFGMFGNDEPPTELVYKIIIPKEEPKQECECTDKCLGYLTKECKRIEEEPKQTDEKGRPMTYWGGLEKPKQETLEEAAQWVIDNRYAKSELEKVSDFEMYNTIIDKCSKWQQERSYSEEEVLEIIRQYALEEHLITSSKPDIWFGQFKKK
jgi:hypothetical protein